MQLSLHFCLFSQSFYLSSSVPHVAFPGHIELLGGSLPFPNTSTATGSRACFASLHTNGRCNTGLRHPETPQTNWRRTVTLTLTVTRTRTRRHTAWYVSAEIGVAVAVSYFGRLPPFEPCRHESLRPSSDDFKSDVNILI